MFRTTAAVLGFALLASAARAADTVEYKVSLDGKSPAQVHAAIESAAASACDQVYAPSALRFWALNDLKACRTEAAQAAQAKADALFAAHSGASAVTGGTR